jgi:hypothetical protein
MDTYAIEPELQRATPRTVRCRRGNWGAITPFWILLLPHMWIAIVAPFCLLFFYSVVFLPARFEGSVVKHSTYTSRKSGEHYQLKIDYSSGGNTHSFSASVPFATYQDTPDGKTVTVLDSGLLPGIGPHLRTDGAVYAGVAFATVWVTVWSGIMFAVAYGMWEPPLRSKSLCANGKAVEGKIVSTSQRATRRSTVYDVVYSYTAIDRRTGRMTPTQFEKKEMLPKGWAGRIQAGDTVTVLYDEKNPKRSIIYLSGDYAAV